MMTALRAHSGLPGPRGNLELHDDRPVQPERGRKTSVG
jgi:hypothetical protein